MNKITLYIFMAGFIIITSCSNDNQLDDIEAVQAVNTENIIIDNIEDDNADFKCKWVSTMSVKFVSKMEYWKQRTKVKFFYTNKNGNEANTGWLTTNKTRTVKKSRRSGNWYIDVEAVNKYRQSQVSKKSYKVSACHKNLEIVVSGRVLNSPEFQ